MKLLCPYCGSENIVRDAYAEWDSEANEWVLRSVYDDMSCDDCGKEFKEATEVQDG
jgi:predicted RNA-binding Zn-ribbon protein involved in translation (DUF1610 family)